MPISVRSLIAMILKRGVRFVVSWCKASARICNLGAASFLYGGGRIGDLDDETGGASSPLLMNRNGSSRCIQPRFRMRTCCPLMRSGIKLSWPPVFVNAGSEGFGPSFPASYGCSHSATPIVGQPGCSGLVPKGCFGPRVGIQPSFYGL